MIKVLFEGSIFLHQKVGGISKYIFKLNQKNSIFKIKSIIFAPINKSFILSKKIKNIIYFFKIREIPIFCSKFFYLINNLMTIIYIRIYKPDLLHLTYYNNFLINYIKIPYILTIYDLIHEKLNKEQHQFKKLRLIENASHIICISNQTKKDLINFYKVKKSKITVIYLGTENKIKKTNLKKKKIILFVGSRVGYKNFINLLKAFGKSKFLKNNFKILCFGGEALTIEEKKIINRLNLRENIIFDNGDENKLNTHYKKASLYVSVSLLEGFGLTLLEAMRMGCPVLCSNISTFNEIFNNSCIFVNPKNIKNIRKKLERVLRSKKEQKKLIQEGFKTVSKYKWDRCIFETANIYKKILNGKKKFDFGSNNKL